MSVIMDPSTREKPVALVKNNIVYEQPLNERMRIFLRLESLTYEAAHNLHRRSAWDSRATLHSVLDISAIVSRADLKTEVIKELERQAANLSRLEDKPGIDHRRLAGILDQLDILTDRLHSITGPVGQEVRENDFLKSVMQRSAVPGGTCHFDLPAYHLWLQQPAEHRIRDLERWLGAFEPLTLSIALILRLVRDSTDARAATAIDGFYQQTLDTSVPYQMIRTFVPAEFPYFAEISGGKHRFTVRFMRQNLNERAVQVAENIDFELACCVV